MPFVKIDSEYSESYVSLQDANTFLNGNQAYPSWQTATDINKSIAILSATRFLDSLNWSGEKLNKTNTLQEIKFNDIPSVPDQNQNAVYISTSIVNYHLANNLKALPVEDGKKSVPIFGTGTSASSETVMNAFSRGIRGLEIGSSANADVSSFGFFESDALKIYLENKEYGSGHALPMETNASTMITVDGADQELIESIGNVRTGEDETDQALAFPRTDSITSKEIIPNGIKLGCIIQAALFLENPTIYTDDTSNTKRLKAGSVEIEYFIININKGLKIPLVILERIRPYLQSSGESSFFVSGCGNDETLKLYYPTYRGV